MYLKSFLAILFFYIGFDRFICIFAFLEKDICTYHNNEQVHFNFIKGQQYRLHVRGSNSTEQWRTCTVDLSTSPGFVFHLRFIYNNSARNICKEQEDIDGGNQNPRKELCPCERIDISETLIWNQTSWNYCQKQRKTQQNLQHEYLSLTNKVRLTFFYSSSEAIKGSSPFTIQYETKMNLHEINGEIVDKKVNRWPLLYVVQKPDMEISTPYFPLDYPLDYDVKYLIRCKNADCQLRIAFTDFLIGSNSVLMIKDSRHKLLYIYHRRNPPPSTIVVSNAHQNLIHLEFFANNSTGIGFRAELYFRKASLLNSMTNDFSSDDCGGLLTEPGGSIKLDEHFNQDYFNCIWIIRAKRQEEATFYWTHIYLRVEDRSGPETIERNQAAARVNNRYRNVNQLTEMSGENVDNLEKKYNAAELTIRKGEHSQGETLDEIYWPYNYQYNIYLDTAEYIIPIHSAYYIRFQGQVSRKFIKFNLVYSFYKEYDCHLNTEFYCENNRCLSLQLYCDGLNHCGDNSDELYNCNQRNISIAFPLNEETFNDITHSNYTLPNVFILFIFIAMTIFISWFIILNKLSVGFRYRPHACRTRSSSTQSHFNCQPQRPFPRLPTISEALDREQTEEEMDFEEPPPIYEPPPSYDEIIKVGMDDQMLQSP